MWRVDSASASATLPAPAAPGTEGYFGPDTIVDQDIMSCLMMELYNAVVAAGLTPSKTDLTQLAQVFALYPTLAQVQALGSLIDHASGTTLALTDAGHVLRYSAGGAGTWHMPDYTTVNFPLGTEITILVAAGGVLTLTIGADYIYWVPSGAGGAGISRTITGPARATLIKESVGVWYIDGPGVS